MKGLKIPNSNVRKKTYKQDKTEKKESQSFG